jgi:hypothetical protein
VKEYLSKMGIPESQLPGPDVRAAGEDLSESTSNEDEHDRAVRITIALGIKPFPIDRTIVIPVVIIAGDPPIDLPPVVITGDLRAKWTIRQIFGQSFSAGVGFGGPGVGVSVAGGPIQYYFELVNRETSEQSSCVFAGGAVGREAGPSVPLKGGDNGGLGVDLKPGLGVSLGTSITTQSHTWNNFNTRRGVGFSDFEGPAFWNEPGSLGFGTDMSRPSTLVLPKIGASVDVTTGHTFGFASQVSSVGYFRCKPPVKLNRR